jgi:putative ABC transport system substrate-binding protein
MRRHSLVLAIANVLLALSLSATAQPPSRTLRVGFFWGATDDPAQSDKIAARQLAARIGRNVEPDSVYMWGSEEDLRRAARELIGRRPDVIVVEGTARTRILQSLTSTIPIVFYVGNPLATRLVSGLAHPGGNATGVSTQECGLIEKRHQLLRDLAPGARRVVFLVPRVVPGGNACQAEVDRLKGVQLLALEALDVSNRADAAKANLKTVLEANPDAILGMGNYPGYDEILSTLALNRHVAIVTDSLDDSSGVLAAVHADQDEAWELALDQVSKILKGARPGDLPVLQTTRFTTEINLRLAKALGISVPDSVILRADRVVQ